MIFVFGDSSSFVFTLFKSSSVQVHSYKGATLKSLTKKTNENKYAIEKTIRKNKNISCVVFTFGQIDLNVSFYYDIIKNNGVIPNGGCLYYSEYIKEYIEWVSNLSGRFRRIIIAPYPSLPNSNHIVNLLISCESLTKEEVYMYHDQLEFCMNDTIKAARYYEFIYDLKKYCIEYSFNRNVIYISLNDYILNENLSIRNEFRNTCEHDIHLRWKPIALYLIKELVINSIQISDNDLVDNIDEIVDQCEPKNCQIQQLVSANEQPNISA